MDDSSEFVRILIVDDHPVVRTGLKSMLNMHSGLRVIGDVSTGTDALAFVQNNPPDIILLDLRLDGQNGIEVLRELTTIDPEVRVIMLTSFELEEDIYQAVQAGAYGYLIKNSTEEEMISVIRKVSVGQRFFSQKIAMSLSEHIMRSSLTIRELEVLGMVARGLSNKEIAIFLNLSSHTVRNHLMNLMDKLGVSDRTDAVVTGVKQGLIRLT
jgi:two-component system NarL family response regulator